MGLLKNVTITLNETPSGVLKKHTQILQHNKLRNLVKMSHGIFIFYLIEGLQIIKLNEPLVDLTHFSNS